ncbi:hypothetical protein KMZ93_04255 [Bradyrhizobium sediminis]|uniref:Uncharacterized protein n=1 Tax=Bradyrhizobium sediminis TaxID=2840469 RepID=A0A975RYG2_9BRAD|nr:hypothetical protein [Bradyrhizobium sediminis]QWG24148.1 hypothetical protein KMZ93_04255 [Bradyrhizobium sediminis]
MGFSLEDNWNFFSTAAVCTIYGLAVESLHMARLPTPGGDSGSWGDVLNAFLQIGHDADGKNIGPLVETSKSAIYTLATTDNGTRIVVTAAVTITVPAVGTLGNGFECEIVNDSGGTVTIDGPGSTNYSMPDGDIVSILEVNSKQRVLGGASTVIS